MSTKRVEEVVTKIHRYCDICGEEIISLKCRSASCQYCRRDLCEKHVHHEDEDNGLPYRFVWCEDCWKLGEEYRPQIEELWNKIHVLYGEWQGKCKKKEVI